MGLGHGFCEARSQVFPEMRVSDFALCLVCVLDWGCGDFVGGRGMVPNRASVRVKTKKRAARDRSQGGLKRRGSYLLANVYSPSHSQVREPSVAQKISRGLWRRKLSQVTRPVCCSPTSSPTAKLRGPGRVVRASRNRLAC
jgi:hypothetical protein